MTRRREVQSDMGFGMFPLVLTVLSRIILEGVLSSLLRTASIRGNVHRIPKP